MTPQQEWFYWIGIIVSLLGMASMVCFLIGIALNHIWRTMKNLHGMAELGLAWRQYREINWKSTDKGERNAD